jgi:hypothetical protein
VGKTGAAAAAILPRGTVDDRFTKRSDWNASCIPEVAILAEGARVRAERSGPRGRWVASAGLDSKPPHSLENMNFRKPIFKSWALIGGFAAVALAGCVSPRVEVPGTLHVHINLPPTTDVWLEDRVKLAFTDVARDVFHRHGFDRPVEEARFASIDERENVSNLLTIDLHRWRVGHIGNIECTFTASLQTPAGTRRLGVFSNTELRGFGTNFGLGRWGIARSFEDAAEGAIEDMVREVARTELLRQLRLSGAAGAT